jgi:hypothetical protein
MQYLQWLAFDFDNFLPNAQFVPQFVELAFAKLPDTAKRLVEGWIWDDGCHWKALL